MYCYQCGKQVEEDVKFCPYCGAQLNSHDQNNGNGITLLIRIIKVHIKNQMMNQVLVMHCFLFLFQLLGLSYIWYGAKNIHCVLNLVSKALLLILFFMF